MELDRSTFATEYNLITQSGRKPVFHYYEITVVAGGQAYEALKVISIDWLRNYVESYADEIYLTAVFPAGTYLKKILPYKENLKIHVVRTPLTEGMADDTTEMRYEQTFRATLADSNQPNALNNRPALSDEETANLAGLQTVHFQLQDMALETLRVYPVGSSYRSMSPYGVLYGTLSRLVKVINTDLENQIQQIDTVEPNNTELRRQILVPHKTLLTQLPTFLQQRGGGIYSAGLGFYLQKSVFYIWPTYDMNRFETSKHKATFLIMPDRKIRSIERSYRLAGNSFVALITGEVELRDPSELLLNNGGNAVRFTNFSRMLEGFGEVANNKVVAKRSYNVNEYVGVARDGVPNQAPVVGVEHGTNPYAQASALALRAGAYLDLTWENCHPDLLVPGMQVEVGYLLGDVPMFMNGVVVASHVYTGLPGMGMHQQFHVTSARFTVMVDRNSPEYKTYLQQRDQSTAG